MPILYYEWLSCVYLDGSITGVVFATKDGIMVRLRELEEWLTPAEAGRIMGISKQGTIKRLETGILRGVKTHQGWLVDPAAASDARQRGRQPRSKKKSRLG